MGHLPQHHPLEIYLNYCQSVRASLDTWSILEILLNNSGCNTWSNSKGAHHPPLHQTQRVVRPAFEPVTQSTSCIHSLTPAALHFLPELPVQLRPQPALLCTAQLVSEQPSVFPERTILVHHLQKTFARQTDDCHLGKILGLRGLVVMTVPSHTRRFLTWNQALTSEQVLGSTPSAVNILLHQQRASLHASLDRQARCWPCLQARPGKTPEWLCCLLNQWV